MEFVLVTFPRVRRVRMDGATQGQTGQVIGVQRGVHIFDLGSPLDYTPPSVQLPVANTLPDAPLVITFQSAALAATVAPMPPPPAPEEAAAPAFPLTASMEATPARKLAKKAAPRKKAARRKTAASRRKAAPRKKAAGGKKSKARARAARGRKSARRRGRRSGRKTR
jgi:hypothetical protein